MKLKVILFIHCLVPIIELIYLVHVQQLGANPQEFILRHLGIWSLVLLFVSYSTSLVSLYGVKSVMNCRRMFGLFSFFYISCHFLAFIAFEHSFVMRDFVLDVFNRPFVFFGTLAALLTVPLALTSNNLSLRLLRGIWKKIHSLINLIIIFALTHYYFHKSAKNDFFWPVALTILLLLIFFLKKKRFFVKGI